MSEDGVRIQVAFESGQSIGATVPLEVADALAAALAAGDAVFELPTEDGTVVLALAKVAYVRRAERETRIGFAASA